MTRLECAVGDAGSSEHTLDRLEASEWKSHSLVMWRHAS